MTKKTVFIAFVSPSGATRKSADILAGELETAGFAARLADLMISGGREVREGLSPGDVLFVGSPVYANHALPAVMDFIERLPNDSGILSVPFVTYGAVTSGVSLYEMAQALVGRGFRLAGGIKIVARHSLSPFFKKPLAPGRPNEYDAKIIQSFARAVAEKARQENPEILSPADLDYQPEIIKIAASKTSLSFLKTALPAIALNEAACIQCGQCEDACPAAALTLQDYPVISDRCILCMNCIAACPSQALTHPALSTLYYSLESILCCLEMSEQRP